MVFFHGIINNSKAMNSYGKALKLLMVRAGVGVATLQKMGLVSARGAFYKMVNDTESPGIAIIEKILIGLGFTWHDWADAMDLVQTKPDVEVLGVSEINERNPRQSKKKKETENFAVHRMGTPSSKKLRKKA